MNNFTCDYCNKSFSTKPNLTAHLKKAKYCINTRDENSTKNIITYECNKCFKSFTSNHGRNKHQEKCKYINNDSNLSIRNISGGEKQRIAFIRSIINEPDISYFEENSQKGQMDSFINSKINNSKTELYNTYIEKFNPELKPLVLFKNICL